MPIATVDHSAMSPNDNGAAYYRVLNLLYRHGAAYGLIQPVRCVSLDGRCIHETSKYVFCGTPSGDVWRFFHFPYQPVGGSVIRADFVDHVGTQVVPWLYGTKDNSAHLQ